MVKCVKACESTGEVWKSKRALWINSPYGFIDRGHCRLLAAVCWLLVAATEVGAAVGQDHAADVGTLEKYWYCRQNGECPAN